MIRQVVISMCAAMAVVSGPVVAQQVRQPVVDKQTGRFYVYHGKKTGTPFVPYGWMPEAASEMLTVDTECKNNPYVDPTIPTTQASPACVAVTVKWTDPWWCGVAWISGPDAPTPWWGEDDRGWHYDLSKLRKRHLVTHLRSEDGARVQLKFGILGDKPHGDSMQFPVESKWIRVGPKWQKVVIDFSDRSATELKRICSGFVLVMSQVQQPNPSVTKTQFCVGDTYYE